MLAETAILSFLIEFWIVVETILYGSTDDFLGCDETIGLSHNLAVDAAWLMSARCSMVFGSLCHRLDLLFSEPLAQFHVVADDASRDEMMGVASFAEPCIVIGGNGVDHIFVDFIMLGKRQASFDNFICMIALMGGVEMVVAWKDLLFDVCL